MIYALKIESLPKTLLFIFFPFSIILILGEPDLRGTGLPPATNNVETRGREEHYGQRSHKKRFGLIQFRFIKKNTFDALHGHGEQQKG